MFEKARIKLTAWYLAIIMAISLSFSVAIYLGVNQELTRLDTMQRNRQQRVDAISNFIIQHGLPIPPENQVLEIETIDSSRFRIISVLGLINLSILIISGIGGYFLAGQTLEPISQMVEEQKDFIGNASHELRTPLTSLMTQIEVALRDKNMRVDEAKALLQSNLEDVNGMKTLSDHLLRLSRYEDKISPIKKSRIDLGEVIEDAVNGAKIVARKKRIRIIKKISKVYVKSNKEAVSELASILIDNAIKYSGKAKQIEVTVKKNKSFEVKDYGIGIEKKDIPHIFDRFYRGEESRMDSKTDGYGLGLSIAKSVTDKLGAKIEVQSKVGHGSLFTVRFPRRNI